MSHHYSSPNLIFPRGDAHLDFTDLLAPIADRQFEIGSSIRIVEVLVFTLADGAAYTKVLIDTFVQYLCVFVRGLLTSVHTKSYRGEIKGV